MTGTRHPLKGESNMKYLIRLEDARTARYDVLLTFDPIPAGTVIGWGSDEHSPDGIAYWTVTSCEEAPNELS